MQLLIDSGADVSAYNKSSHQTFLDYVRWVIQQRHLWHRFIGQDEGPGPNYFVENMMHINAYINQKLAQQIQTK